MLKQFTNVVVLSVICCFINEVKAQQQGYFSNIEYITSNEGLSQGEVTAILQDSKGFLWIGTRGGLNRYDGNNIKVFQNEIGNPNSLINNSIETLFEDSKGQIWIGTKSNGVNRYIPELDKFEQIIPDSPDNSSLPNARVISIEESTTKEIWIGTWKHGLTIYNPRNNTSKLLLKNSTITDILNSKDGYLWITTANGFIAKYSPQGDLFHREDLGSFTSILEDNKTGVFYLGSWSRGPIEFDPKTFISKPLIPEEKYKNINSYSLYQDKEGTILIGTWGNGILKYDLNTKSITHFDLTPVESSEASELFNDVISIFQDDTGILWFGTNGGGLCKADNYSNQFGYSKKNKTDLPKEPIWAILKGNDNLLWVGIRGNKKLYYSEDSKIFSTLNLPSTRGNRKAGIKSIYQDNAGTYWFGGNYNSIFKLQDTKKGYELKPFEIQGPEELSKKITAIYQTKNNIFWIGTQQNGLGKSVAPGNPENQLFERYLDKERITTFFEDSSGRLWVGTYNGLYLYKAVKDKFEHSYTKINKLNSLSSNIVICIFEDSKHNLWIGTDNGLDRVIFEKNNSISFKTYQVKDGLPNDYIHAILEDNHDNLWISTNKGISKFNLENDTFYNYDVNDGLQFNSFIDCAAIKDKTGTFYFGGDYGLNSFHPDSIKNSTTPSVNLTALKISGQEIHSGELYNDRHILNKSINYTDEIVLTENENIFSLEYAALDFSSSSHLYNIKMEGLNKEWQTSTQNNITYSNLMPGNYTFKVKVIGDDFTNDSKETSLKIKILPPFWKTWQALVLYTLLFIGLLYLFKYIITEQSVLKNNLALEKLERKKEEELTKMKTQFFTDIAHEFRTPLSLISGPVETLLDNELNEDERKGQLSTIQYHTKRLLSLIGQLLDFRKAESGKMKLQVATGNFAKFTHEIFLSFKDLAESKNVQFNLNLDNNDTPLTYDRGKMEIVLCNLLSNAFKYTNSKIDVTLSIKGVDSLSSDFLPDFELGYCEISVIDNGKGMSEDITERIFDRFYQISNSDTLNQIGTGIGLALVKNIVELHKGHVFVNSELNNGSQFIIQLPLGEVHFSKGQFISDFKKAEDPVHYQVERILSDSQETTIISNSKLPTLLMVEDNPEIRSYIKIIFQNTYKVIEAENGLVGLEKALKFIPEIIITDLMMPKMDGMTLCRELRTNEQTLQIPIIMLTARTSTVHKEKGYNSGADIFVTKPFNPSVLKAQVEGLLKSRKKLKEYFGKKITLLPTELDHTSVDEEFLNKVMKLVEDNLTNYKLNREFLASRMAVSPSTLYRKIKSITELDITIFIRSIRLKRAAQMIQNKEDNISGIAYQVGFNDPKYFRKCFIKQFGVTPSKFGKKL